MGCAPCLPFTQTTILRSYDYLHAPRDVCVTSVPTEQNIVIEQGPE